jgi:hypothetical protein
MYKEERSIGGKLCVRYSPHDEFVEYTQEELTAMVEMWKNEAYKLREQLANA